MTRIVLCFTLLFLLSGGLIAALNAQPPDTTEQPVVIPFEDARFVSLDPGQPNAPELAKLWGDPDQGPSTVLLRMRKGEGARHLHTSDYHLVLLEGKMKHWTDEEKKMRPNCLDPGATGFSPEIRLTLMYA